MENLRISPLQEALEIVEALEPEDQIALLDLVKRRLAEQRRGEIANSAAILIHTIREGKANFGSFHELKDDLLGEP